MQCATVEIAWQWQPTRSRDTTARTTVRFINQTPRTLKLYWVDADGKRQARGTLEPQESVTQRTFASHVWLVAGPDDRPVALYVAAEKRGIAAIR